MRLLVSVRSAAEVEAAVEGGADIIDAKEPSRGSLGPVDAVTLGDIAAAVPGGVPLSIALGDVASPAAIPAAMDLIRVIARRPGGLYVKVGLAGVAEPALARSVLEHAASAARGVPLAPEVVAVAYADHDLAGTLAPEVLLDAAVGTGVRGVLLDTWGKAGQPLFAWTGSAAVRGWLRKARDHGLLTALAGSLSADHADLLYQLGPDVFGVRGAACEGGRWGTVSAGRVAALAAGIRRLPRARAPA